MLDDRESAINWAIELLATAKSFVNNDRTGSAAELIEQRLHESHVCVLF